MPKVNETDCVGCEECSKICPQNAIIVDEVARINMEKCVNCDACVDICPTCAIDIA